jgi:predicted membrane protein
MGFIFSGVFWGCILILLGLSVIIRIVFNVHIPLFRIVFALVLIYFGIRVLAGGAWCRSGCHSNTAIFSDMKAELNKDSNEYNIIFGKGVVDLTDSSLALQRKKIKVTTVFGSGEIRINSDVPAIIRVTSAFSGAKMPDGNIVSFGEYTYKTKKFSEKTDFIRIDATVVFGGLEINER